MHKFRHHFPFYMLAGFTTSCKGTSTALQASHELEAAQTRATWASLEHDMSVHPSGVALEEMSLLAAELRAALDAASA